MANQSTPKAKLLLALTGTVFVGMAFSSVVDGTLQAPAQSPDPSKHLTFEVASIKPSHSSNDGMDIRTAPGGSYVAHGITLRNLILNAYDLHDFQLTGGPDWIASAKFDIVAKAEEADAASVAAQREARRQRLQSLLVDRFNFKFHTTKRELPIYSLVVMKAGPKLRNATNIGNGSSMTMRRGQLIADSLSMERLAANLSNLVDRIVQDRTGLTGSYNLKLEWAAEQEQPAPLPGSENNVPPADIAGPSIFTALQEQLGLRLEPRKGEVETLVIDHVQKPSDN